MGEGMRRVMMERCRLTCWARVGYGEREGGVGIVIVAYLAIGEKSYP